MSRYWGSVTIAGIRKKVTQGIEELELIGGGGGELLELLLEALFASALVVVVVVVEEFGAAELLLVELDAELEAVLVFVPVVPEG